MLHAQRNAERTSSDTHPRWAVPTQLNSRGVSAGDINGLFTAFGEEHQLQVLVIRNTSISGKLDAGCDDPSYNILRRLFQLQVETSPVTGAVPHCVMSSVTTLSLKHTDIGGPLRPFPANSTLRVLELVQVRRRSTARYPWIDSGT